MPTKSTKTPRQKAADNRKRRAKKVEAKEQTVENTEPVMAANGLEQFDEPGTETAEYKAPNVDTTFDNQNNEFKEGDKFIIQPSPKNVGDYVFNISKARALCTTVSQMLTKEGFPITVDDLLRKDVLLASRDDADMTGRVLQIFVSKFKNKVHTKIYKGDHPMAPERPTKQEETENKNNPDVRWKCDRCGLEQEFDIEDSACRQCGRFPDDFGPLFITKGE